MHFRGPMNLYQLAVYNLGSEKPKRELKPSIHERRHGHSHQRFHEKRAIGDTVVATINGEVVSWANNYGGPGNPAPTPAPGAKDPQVKNTGGKPNHKSEHKGNGGKSPNIPAGVWGRIAYYNSESKESSGLTFLNNDGAWSEGVTQAFGCALNVIDDFFGMSSKPNFPNSASVPDGEEVIIMSDRECNGDSCGYTRDGAAAYRRSPIPHYMN